MIHYKHLIEEELLILSYQGEIKKDYLVHFIQFLFERYGEKMPKRLINDFRNTQFAFDLEELDKVLEFRKAFVTRKEKYKTVYLVDDLQTTVLITLFAHGLEQLFPHVLVCSTLDYAIRHLSLAMPQEELQKELATPGILFPVNH